MTDVKLALASDTPYLPHTMVAMLSVLENATRPVAVHILGDEFSADAKRVVEKGCRRNGAADLVFHDLEDILPRIGKLRGHWPRGILTRLHIPNLIDGRVLYLDGDTYTFADISPLFEMDLGENLIAAVRDFGVLLKFQRHTEIAIRETKNAEKVMHPFPRHDYFSSGVVLFDCDRIRMNDGILSSLTCVGNVNDHVFPDQDHLNIIFRNRVLFLHPSWNAFYGLTRHAVRVAQRVLPPDAVHDLQKPKIIHYVDGPKPWWPFELRWLPKTSMMVKRFPRYLEYRFNERRLLAPYRAAIDDAVGGGAGLAPPHGGERADAAEVRIQIALCTDMAYLRHAWVAMASVIERASAPVTVHLVGDGLTRDAVERLTEACRELADARLHHHDVTDLLTDAQSRVYFSRAMMGRMFLPQLTDGRVLYLDPDTIAYADVRPLFEMDMGAAKVAAVRDYTILGTFRKEHSRGVSACRDQIELMRPLPVFEYFNSGVILMDCTAIKQDADVVAKMTDISAASGFSFPDQDLLNSIFKNQVHFLDHSWNCLWGQSRRMARIARATLPAGPERRAIPAKIVHFVGPRKPWEKLGSVGWSRMFEAKTLAATIRYRMAARRLSRYLGEGDVGDARPNAPQRPQTVADSLAVVGRTPAPGRAGDLGHRRLDVAISTDPVFLNPSLVAMASVLRHSLSPVCVHFLGDGLSDLDRKAAEAACHRFEDAQIVHHDMTELLKDAPSIGHLPKAAMGRALLPKVTGGGGRILHLDADTLTCGDITPLFRVDMQGHPVAAVRDFAILDTFRKGSKRGERKYSEQIELMKPFGITDYFNSGVMLLDCDAMSPELSDAMTDSLSLEATRFLDQDFLNRIFKGRVAFLEPQWNVPWGRADRGSKVMDAYFPEVRFDRGAPPRIVHFPGRKKPWHRTDPFRMVRFGRATLQYRRAAEELVERFW